MHSTTDLFELSLSIIFNSLPAMHLMIITLIIIKAIHFNMYRRSYWNIYQYVHFDNVELKMSENRKTKHAKKAQNKMTQIIFVLIVTDGIFYILKSLISYS